MHSDPATATIAASVCQSCDTFVCLPPATDSNVIIFGKNSDRPSGEVQEIVQFPAREHEPGTKLHCTYIEIGQAPRTSAVILSKPSWMWGAEMGANEYGVCIGNEAVWTKLNSDDDLVERLLGMDLVRLGLERGKTARDALDVITTLLELHGQGGSCSDTIAELVYHNSFLIVDTNEAWVLETTGKLWVAERVVSSFRNISNILSIGSNIDLMSSGLKENAESLGLWKAADGEFHFTKVFGKEYESGSARLAAGAELLKQHTNQERETVFDIASMMAILRNEESGICRSCTHPFPSTSSQISVLSPQFSCHWFTGTPDPRFAVFKPFVFTSNGAPQTSQTTSPTFADEKDPPIPKPSFAAVVDRRHPLYKAHDMCSRWTNMFTSPEGKSVLMKMRDLENSLMKRCKCTKLGHTILDKDENFKFGEDLNLIFKEAVNLEMKLYSEHLNSLEQ